MTYAQPAVDPTDVVWRRIGAYAIDGLIIAALAAAVLIPMFLSASDTAPSGTIECSSSRFDDSASSETSFQFQADSNFCFDNGDTVRYMSERMPRASPARPT